MKVEVGKKYSRPSQPGIIWECVFEVPDYAWPFALICRDKYRGVMYVKEDGRTMLTNSSDARIVEWAPYRDFKKDDPVMVQRNGMKHWCRRYFSHAENGIPYTFFSGGTSWSAKNKTLSWDVCRRPTEEELNS